MKTVFHRVLVALCFTTIIISCSVRKDNLFNRNYHAISAEYNILYNGYVAQKEIIEKLKETNNNDSFWEILDVEPIHVKEDKGLYISDKVEQVDKSLGKIIFKKGVEKIFDVKPSKEQYAQQVKIQRSLFKIPENKAVKAIQQHSMNIDKRERNPQIDEAYMLLGTSRYYSGRFIPAQDAFNYILYNYPGSDKIAQATIWREKSNIRLGNNQLAITNLKKLFKQEKLFQQDYADAMVLFGQAYINLRKIDSAAGYIKNAAELTKNKEYKARYYYILGQISERIKETDSAIISFEKVINFKRKASRKYYVNAYLELIMLKSKQNQLSDEELFKLFDKMKKNKSNISFLDKILYTRATFEVAQNATKDAEIHYKQAIKKSRDSLLKVYSYEALAKMRLEDNRYLETSEYYDSILMFAPKKGITYFNYRQKRRDLETIIQHEKRLNKDDSIIKIATLPMYAKKAYFEKLTKEKQNKEQISKKENDRDEATKQGNFYFYNSVALLRGKEYFIRKWGDIPLKDNWRYDKSIKIDTLNDQSKEEDSDEGNKTDKLKKFLKESEFNKTQIDSIRREMNAAYFQLALIYKGQFKNYNLAEKRLKSLLSNYPDDQLKLPAQYHLYLIYKITDDKKAFFLKQDIIKNSRGSFYAELLKNENNKSKKVFSQLADKRYNKLYQMFLEDKYQKVISLAKTYAIELSGRDIAPKIELLKAIAIGRLKGIRKFRTEIERVKMLYPNSFESGFLSDFQKQAMVKLSNSSFEGISKEDNWKLVFVLPYSEKNKTKDIADKLEQIKGEYRYQYLTISLDLYTDNINFIVIHGFGDKEESLGFQELLSINSNIDMGTKNFVISSANYTKLLLHKNLNNYKVNIN